MEQLTPSMPEQHWAVWDNLTFRSILDEPWKECSPNWPPFPANGQRIIQWTNIIRKQRSLSHITVFVRYFLSKMQVWPFLSSHKNMCSELYRNTYFWIQHVDVYKIDHFDFVLVKILSHQRFWRSFSHFQSAITRWR